MRRIERIDPDVVHVQWLPRPELDLRWLRRVADDRPLVLTAHDVLPRRRRAQPVWPDVLETAERVIVHSHRAVEQLVELGLGRERIARIPHPVFEGEKLPPPEGRTLLFFGLIRDYKGLDVLLEALPEIPDASLVVAGDPVDPVQQRDHRRACRVAAPLHRGRTRCPTLMTRAAAVVLPYRRLDSSGVLATAIGYRRPVVVTDVGSLGEIVREFGAGEVVPADDDPRARGSLRAPARAEEARRSHERGRARREGADLGALRRGPRRPLPRGQTMRLLKRVGDRLAAAVLLILLSPLLAAIALWILLDGGRPAILAQDRAGKHGTTFRMLKYRTMVQNALELAAQLTDDPFGVVENDPRITRPGRFLRRSGLDELPQLWNVVRGEMSLVGPRPDLVEQARNYTEHDRRRLAVEPGDHWLVPGERPRGDRLARADRAGHLVHRPLVARPRPEDPLAHVQRARPQRREARRRHDEHRAALEKARQVSIEEAGAWRLGARWFPTTCT